MYEKALEAIRDLFGDTSVSQEETLELLETLKGELEIFKIDEELKNIYKDFKALLEELKKKGYIK